MTSPRSAAESGLPKAPTVQKPVSDVGPRSIEGALQDANFMADITFAFIGAALGFDKATPPVLSARDAELVYWATSQTAHLIELADKAFQAAVTEGT